MILIAAGSNLPFCGLDSQQIVLRSFFAIGRCARVIVQSPLYTSPAWPDPRDPVFVNAAARLETDLEPPALLALLHAVEAAFGRRRDARNAPRTLDLDLLAHNDVVSDGGAGAPILPHPGIEHRDFVLAPVADIAPDWRPPGQSKTASELLDALPSRTATRIG
jgi:2-amino-4-hydroxy-6-hydroxymethyldihydropteridine diphosphokinase